MTANRFEEIKRFLHFSDNSMQSADKLHKIRPLIEQLRTRFVSVPMEENLSVDEQIVPFKGRSCLRQYYPKKPHKWGYKIWVLCGASGYAYDFECYTGRSDNTLLEGEEDCGASGNVVIRLSRAIPANVNHKLFFDNYFTSPDLQLYLAKKGIWSIGTVRGNRIPQCSLKADVDLRKLGRGAFDEKVAVVDDIEIASVRCFDNKAVTLLSTFAGCQPTTEVTRWNGKELCHEKVKCPNIVSIYNKHMGGVDLIDSLIGLYRNKLRSKKWYHRLFFHMLDMTVINAWLLYRRRAAAAAADQGASKTMTLHEFKASIAEALCKVAVAPRSLKRGRPQDKIKSTHPEPIPKKRAATVCAPVSDVRFDGVHHYPAIRLERRRCKRDRCNKITQVACTKCNVHLCLSSKQNCFIAFHTK